MRTKDLLEIATAALGTATLTVVFLASPRMTGTDTNPQGAAIAKPKLVANGIEMTLSSANGREFKAGDQPEFELRAVNTLDEPAEVSVCATLSALQVAGPELRLVVSRMGPIPKVLWRQEFALSLKPNETKVFPLAARTNLPANSEITVILSQVDPSGNTTAAPLKPGARPIVSMRFSTVPPAADPSDAAAPVRKAAASLVDR